MGPRDASKLLFIVTRTVGQEGLFVLVVIKVVVGPMSIDVVSRHWHSLQ